MKVCLHFNKNLLCLMLSSRSQELTGREEGVALKLRCHPPTHTHLPCLVESAGGSAFNSFFLYAGFQLKSFPQRPDSETEPTPTPFPVTIFTAIHIVTQVSQNT